MSGDEKVKQEAKRESKVQSCLKTASSLSAQGSLRICGSKDLPSPLLGPGGTRGWRRGTTSLLGTTGKRHDCTTLGKAMSFPRAAPSTELAPEGEGQQDWARSQATDGDLSWTLKLCCTSSLTGSM